MTNSNLNTEHIKVLTTNYLHLQRRPADEFTDCGITERQLQPWHRKNVCEEGEIKMAVETVKGSGYHRC